MLVVVSAVKLLNYLANRAKGELRMISETIKKGSILMNNTYTSIGSSESVFCVLAEANGFQKSKKQY